MSPVVVFGNKFSTIFFFRKWMEISLKHLCGYCGSKGKMLAIIV